MQIDAFRHEDVDAFLSLAAEENWISGRWEFDVLLRHFPQGCLAARADSGPMAFITSVRYGSSGWIGNLIVHKNQRSKGVGSALMVRATEILLGAGARTVWLTASEAGKPIYERLGFRAIDVIKRWHGTGRGCASMKDDYFPLPEAVAIDQAGWGDARETILSQTRERGTLAAFDGGFLISQPLAIGVQLGPWGVTEQRTAVQLLDTAQTRAGSATALFLDVPAHNVDAARLLYSRGFNIGGSALLMYLGEKPAYDPSRIYALATMGSMG